MFCQYPVQTRLRNFLLSLPERGLRSATALAGGLLREVGDVAIPKTIRRSQLYRNLVEATLQFLIEQVGQVKGVYPGGEKLSQDFLVRRAAGNGIELIGILTFHASPVWVLESRATYVESPTVTAPGQQSKCRATRRTAFPPSAQRPAGHRRSARDRPQPKYPALLA